MEIKTVKQLIQKFLYQVGKKKKHQFSSNNNRIDMDKWYMNPESQ